LQASKSLSFRFWYHLSGKYYSEDNILKLEGLTIIVPIITVEGGTYGTNRMGDIKSKICTDNTIKSNLN
jgi:hypothetical protein